MKKKVMLIFVIISILAMTFAVAAKPVEKKVVRLTGIYFVNNQLVVKFFVKGFTPRTDLRASISLDKLSYPLKCSFDGVRSVVCKMKNMNRYAGLSSRIWLSGAVFYTQIPWK